jgi:hypothetical protein
MTLIDTPPAIEIPAPALIPAPFGLFSVALQPAPADNGWQGGVWWQVNGCNDVGITYGVCNVDSVVPALDPNVTCDIATAQPFTVYARSDLSMGGMPLAQRQQRARDVLQGGEQHAVEQMLWQMFLAATPTPDDTATSQQEAIARVEGLVRDSYGGTPVLHLSPFTATMISGTAFRVEGGVLQTFLGSRVVAGSGYDVASPGPTDAVSVVGTGNIVVVRGDIFDVGQVINRETNQVDSLVERTYVVGWDCTAVRVEVPAT